MQPAVTTPEPLPDASLTIAGAYGVSAVCLLILTIVVLRRHRRARIARAAAEESRQADA